jgi:AraC-like DNA-binding protein
MDRKTSLKKIERLKWLIEKESAGKPKDFARSLEVSERTLYRLVNDVKDFYGVEITYSRFLNRYIIEPSDRNNS